jgi:DNA-binding MarR family transcriptional regulator
LPTPPRKPLPAPLAEFNRTIATIELFRDFNKRITGTHMLTFCYVARDEAAEITSTDLVRRFDVSDATISKQLQGLMEGPEALLRFEADPIDTRRKIIRLTGAGRRLRDRLLESFANHNLTRR